MKPISEYETCAYCPRLCRPVCPVAVGSAREAATPTAMMTGPFLGVLGTLSREEAGAYAALCVSCGACTEHCREHRPVAELLAAARSTLLDPPTPAPLGLVEGAAAWVAVECDGRPWGRALAARLGQPIARFVTTDHLGEPLLDHPEAFAVHARDLRDRLAGRTLVVADLGCARAARVAGLSVKQLAELVPPPEREQVFHPCEGARLPGQPSPDALVCCGARAPLLDHHPEIAAELAQAVAARLGGRPTVVADARCSSALRAAGARTTDPVTALLNAERT